MRSFEFFWICALIGMAIAWLANNSLAAGIGIGMGLTQQLGLQVVREKSGFSLKNRKYCVKCPKCQGVVNLLDPVYDADHNVICSSCGSIVIPSEQE